MNDSGPVLVTGTSGFIGRRLVEVLEQRGQTCVPAAGRLERELICSPGIRKVVHLAGRSYVPESWQNPLAFYETNVLGTARVLEYCRANAARLIHISSYVYGKPRQLPISEDHPTDATTPYTHSKLLAEECCRFYAEQFGLSIVVVRPFNIFGPFQDRRFLIPGLAWQVIDPACDRVGVLDAEPRRDFLFVDDLVELVIRAIDDEYQGVLNAGSGRSVSVREVFEVLSRLAGCPHKQLVSQGERRAGEVMDVVADTRRATQVLGWQPSVTLEEGLGRVLAECRRAEPEGSSSGQTT